MATEECKEIIQAVWHSELNSHNDRFTTHTSKVLDELSKWSVNKFGDLNKKIKTLKEKLKQIQCNPRYDPNQEMHLKRELDSLLEMEEIY